MWAFKDIGVRVRLGRDMEAVVIWMSSSDARPYCKGISPTPGSDVLVRLASPITSTPETSSKFPGTEGNWLKLWMRDREGKV